MPMPVEQKHIQVDIKIDDIIGGLCQMPYEDIVRFFKAIDDEIIFDEEEDEEYAERPTML